MGMIGNTLAQGLISGANIVDGTVDTPDIKDSAVTAAKIATGVVTPGKLSTGAPTWDTSGNLGLGVTPLNAYTGSGFKAYELPKANIYSFDLGSRPIAGFSVNSYLNSSAVAKYIATGYATLYESDQGQHRFYTAASGTAGNTITFTQAMTLDASGNFMVGATSANGRARFVAAASADCILNLETSTNNYASGVVLTALNDNGAIYNYILSKTNGGTEHWKIGGVGASSALAFSTGGSERARIDSSGNLLIGVTSGSSKVRILGTGTTTPALSFSGASTNYAQNISAETGLLGTSYGTISMGVANPGNGYYISFTAPDGSYNYAIRGSIALSGTSIAYNTSSDYRLKKDIAPMTGALAKVALLKPVTYKWLDDSDGEGFIAHELAEVVPQCVTGEKDAVDVDGNPVYQGIDTSFLVATLVKAIQEQQAIITSLTERITALEAA